MGLFDLFKPKKKEARKLPEEKPRKVVHLDGPDKEKLFVINKEVLRGIKVGQPFEVKLSHLSTTVKSPDGNFVWKSTEDDINVPVLYNGKPFGNAPGMWGMVRLMFRQYKTLRATATITRWKRSDEYPTVEVSMPTRGKCKAFVETAEKMGLKYAKLGCTFHCVTIPEKCATENAKTQCMPKPLTVTIGEANKGHRSPVMVAIGKTTYFRVHASCYDYDFLVGLVDKTDCMAMYEAVEKENGGYKYRLYVSVGCEMPE